MNEQNGCKLKAGSVKGSMLEIDCRVHVLRRAQVLSILDNRIALINKQVAAVVFELTNYGLWKASVETKKLFDAGLVRRTKIMGISDWVYFRLGKRPDDLEHKVLQNWVWVKYEKSGNLQRWKDEPVLEGLQPDAFFVWNGQPYFLEVHREVNTRFDKPTLYTQYFKTGVWATEDWPGGERFATILVVCDTMKAKQFVEKHIARQNDVGLRFKVQTLEEMWKEVR